MWVQTRLMNTARRVARDAPPISVALLTVATAGQAQQTSEIPDLSWGYIRVDRAGSGTFGGLTSEFEPARLAEGLSPPPPRRELPDEVDDIPRENGALVVTDGNCDGPPGIEPNSAGFWYVQTPDEVLIVGENAAPTWRTAALRRVYMDGRSHPDLARWTPTGAGHSIGWYEDGALIVETIGMEPGPVMAGGYKTPETRLVERFDVFPANGTMTITYTWHDPKIYARPHSYTLHFERIPDEVHAFEAWCDTGDPATAYSVAPPESE
jgi:hypothetical protein